MKKIVLVLLILVIITGCVYSVNEKEVEKLHLSSIQGVLDGDAKKAAEPFSQEYIDLGDGSKKSLNEDYFNNIFSSDFYNTNLKGKTAEQLFDLQNKEVYSYDEVINTKYKELITSKGFEMKKGDVFVYYPQKQGSGLPEGFMGIYRKENDNWKIVAGD